ncbi:hypothetical protein DE146DRAFT_643737 [Phaeosphaeria sp. MPI-PUGE-AT-0046c]|nr:hypothetical protein DE146DRAFT_643737 [Phaeosphaeria sp. MPI-PUGE-AT-0046c]
MIVALEDCYKLVKIAEHLGCTRIVGKSIEVALLKHGQKFFISIKNAPHQWAPLAYSVRSELIFRESFVHLVGNWKNIKNNHHMAATLRKVPGMRGLIEKYHRALLARCKDLELQLMSEYPGDIAAPSQILPIKREEYMKNILVHLALMFFRHWLGNYLISDKGRHALDCGYNLYRQIYAAGESYMDKTVMNSFHHMWPMTQRAFTVVENHLGEIKEVMKQNVVKSKLLDSTCQLDIRKHPVPYFTCTDFKNEDFPWLKEDAAATIVSPKRMYKAGGNEIARQNFEASRRAQEREQVIEDDEAEENESEVDVEEELDGMPSKRARTN